MSDLNTQSRCRMLASHSNNIGWTRYAAVLLFAMMLGACGGGGGATPGNNVAPPTGGTLLFSEISGQCARESLSGNIWCWGDQRALADGTGLTVGTSQNNPNYSTVFTEPTELPSKSLTNIIGGNGWVCGLDVVDTWCIGDSTSHVTSASSNATGPARQWKKINLPTGVVLSNLVGGGYFACGLGAANSPDQTTVGKVYCWGDNLRGYLGRGDFANGDIVDAIKSSYRYVALAASSGSACAIRETSGEVDCWGDNSYGEINAGGLGSSSSTNMSSTPIPRNLTLDPSPGAIRGGDYNFCGLKIDGTAYCWGDNFYGQRGNGSASTGNYGQNFVAPSAVPGMKFKSIWPGETVCGIATDNVTYCWGAASSGSLGNGVDHTADGKQTTPTAISGGYAFASMSNLQYGGKCGHTANNDVYCWGSNRFYNLGLDSGTPPSSSVPTHIKNSGLYKQVPAQ